MNTMFLFRRLVFALVLLGMVASCVGERNPGLLLIVGAIGAMSWYVTEGPSGRTLPRWMVNVGALLAVGWLAVDLVLNRVYVVSAMTHFTMALQLLILYARKTDREYAQLLVLSLLQMIGTSVLSVSMIYGVFLGLYCVIALATTLLFHLTATAEQVHLHNLRSARGGAAPARPQVTAGRGTRRQLRVVGLGIGLVCAVVAAAVFLVVPRTGRSGLNLTPVAGQAPAQTGFTSTVRLGAGPIGTGSREPMLNLKIKVRGQAVGWKELPWLVRGAALDHYDVQSHTWVRSAFADQTDKTLSVEVLNARPLRPEATRQAGAYTAEITLRDARPRVIFSVVPTPTRRESSGFDLLRFDSDVLQEVSFSPVDQHLRATASVVGAVQYRVSWVAGRRSRAAAAEVRGSPPSLTEIMPAGGDDAVGPPQAAAQGRAGGGRLSGERSGGRFGERLGGAGWRGGARAVNEVTARTYARGWTVERDRVAALAQRVLRDAGIERDPEARHTADDLRAAAALAEYLRRGYRYDLNNPAPRRGGDPVTAFLFETRSGHCELFAAGLIALCRSSGIPARMVTGFRASEFNTMGEYYVVRQSNAHAWVEVDGGPGMGWRTLDATPQDRVEAEHRAPEGVLASVRELYEHLEFAWIRRVVAFDVRTQEGVIDNVRATVSASSRRIERETRGVGRWARGRWAAADLGYAEAVGLALGRGGLLIAGAILLRLAVVRRRRMSRLKLAALPAEVRQGLGRRLGFYLAMQDLLERHGQRRPAWQTPSGFARSLAEMDPSRFGPVVPLTELFYEIRFGHHPLDDARRQQAREQLKALEQAIGGGRGG
ncbi:MAG: transglutaminaseTgpA domain-containing protein [Planctomycetota bacterium]